MRRFIVLCLLCLAVAAPAAAGSPRAAPANNMYVNRQTISLGSTTVQADIDEATIEAGEAAASCSAGIDNRSVWYTISMPKGRLRVETDGSNYSTILALYPIAPMTDSLSEIACAYSAGGRASLSKNVKAGTYVLRVSNGDVVPPMAMSLTLETSLTPPKGAAMPANDSFGSPLPLTINKKVKTRHLEYATRDPFVPAIACAPTGLANSVWYSFEARTNGTVVISAEGTILSYPTYHNDNVTVALYRISGVGAVTPVACDSGSGLNGAGRISTFLAAGTYRVGIGHFNSDLQSPSLATLTVSMSDVQMVRNGTFADDLTGWSVKKASGDGLVTGAAAIGGASFRFTGSANEASMLKQTIPLNDLLIKPDSLLNWAGDIRCSVAPVTQLTVKVKAVRANGQSETLSFKLPSPATSGLTTSVARTMWLTRGKPKKLVLSIKNKMPAGDCVLDNIRLHVFTLTTGRDGVLPPPPPPAP